MKNITFLLSLIILVSCSSDDDAGNIITHEFEQIEIILPKDQWKVAYFFEYNEDHTIDFENFIFDFNEDGTVIGQTDLFTEQGTWTYRSTAEHGERLELKFENTTPFDKITYAWNIVSLSVSKVELTYTDSNDQVIKLLTFEKID